jgi:hypothetical protein
MSQGIGGVGVAELAAAVRVQQGPVLSVALCWAVKRDMQQLQDAQT